MQKYRHVTCRIDKKTGAFVSLVATGTKKETKGKKLGCTPGGLRGLAGPNKKKRRKELLLGC